jgi:hypothetical protein
VPLSASSNSGWSSYPNSSINRFSIWSTGSHSQPLGPFSSVVSASRREKKAGNGLVFQGLCVWGGNRRGVERCTPTRTPTHCCGQWELVWGGRLLQKDDTQWLPSPSPCRLWGCRPLGHSAAFYTHPQWELMWAARLLQWNETRYPSDAGHALSASRTIRCLDTPRGRGCCCRLALHGPHVLAGHLVAAHRTRQTSACINHPCSCRHAAVVTLLLCGTRRPLRTTANPSLLHAVMHVTAEASAETN